jgi:glyoxylase-like metal-dependent hydrolase (beta-lactamase superfamily II)
VLIDGGPREAGPAILRFLNAHTREPLDLVLLTHRHADHLARSRFEGGGVAIWGGAWAGGEVVARG